MKNKERINSVRVELDNIKQENSDMETLKVYTKILEDIEKDILELQERIVKRMDGILDNKVD